MRHHIAAIGEDHVWFQLNQFRGQIGQTLHLAFGIAIVDGYRLSIHIAKALQALEQRTD
jgi:hypothetical protein